MIKIKVTHNNKKIFSHFIKKIKNIKSKQKKKTKTLLLIHNKLQKKKHKNNIKKSGFQNGGKKKTN